MDSRVERALKMYEQVVLAVINSQGNYLTILPLAPGGQNAPVSAVACALAGSILKVREERALTEFFAHRSSQTVTIKVQIGCPVAYGLGHKTMRDQRDLWRSVERECRAIAKDYEVLVVFECATDGEVIDLLT
jgi:hypothetical protein